MLTVGVGGAAAFLTSSFAARASSSPWTGSRTQTAWRGGSRTSKVDVAVESSRVSTAAGTAPVVSEEALRLQEQLRKLCADKSEADRETRIEALAKVGVSSFLMSIRVCFKLNVCPLTTDSFTVEPRAGDRLQAGE